MDRLKILLATTQYAPEIGGVPVLLWGYSACQHTVVDLSVLSLSNLPPAAYRDFDAAAPFPIERVVPARFPGGSSLRFLVRLWQRCRAEKPDVILSGVSYPTAILAWLVHRVTGTPYVAYAHSEDITIPGRLKRSLLARALRSAAGVLTISGFSLRRLLEMGLPASSITRIPPGIVVETFQNPQPLPLLHSLDRRFILLTVGRLVLRKGQDTVLRALPAILAQVPNAHYLVVGGGPDEDRLRSLAGELGVQEQVTFAGALPESALPACYAACSLYVMPTRPSDDGSEVEGFGIVYLEAAAAGKASIGGRAGGVASAIVDGETGLLVDPQDTAAVAEAVIRLAKDGTLRTGMGRAGLARVQAEFSLQPVAERTTAAIQQFIQPGGSPT